MNECQKALLEWRVLSTLDLVLRFVPGWLDWRIGRLHRQKYENILKLARLETSNRALDLENAEIRDHLLELGIDP